MRPDDPDIVFAADHAGLLTRYDHRSGQVRTINVWPEATSGIAAKDIKYRFNWTAPVALSPHDPEVLYTTSQYVHRSKDEGTSWTRVSPDLTRNDPKTTGDSGGPITLDQTGAEYHATIFAFAESPVEPGVLWAGSDDGLIHVSRDNGKKWTNVTPRIIAAQTLISIIEPSPHDAAVAYVASNRYKHDDFKPYLYKTENHGRSWSKITAGIPADTFVRAVREDPEVRGLLYAGTEVGLYVSYDDGARWHRWMGKSLPVVPIHDLIVKDGDLALATHGRSFWVFDDLSPVRELARKRATGTSRLFTPRPTIRYRTYGGFSSKTEMAPMKNYRHPGGSIFSTLVEERPNGDKIETNLDAGKNPPDGVIVSYFLRGAPKNITLSFYDSRGRLIRSYTKRPPNPDPKDKEPRVPVEPGMNRFIWDMRYPDAGKIDDEPQVMDQLENALKGPVAAPGSYSVRLDVDGEKSEAKLEIRTDPRIAATQTDLDAQFALRLKLRDLLRLNHRIGSLIGSVASADAVPTKQAVELADQLADEIAKLEKRLSAATRGRGRRKAA